MATVAIEPSVIDTTEGCRYCLMCRHVCPVTRVTYNEATSPHGWALAIASVRRGQLQWNAETADLLYKCADCGLCQAFCVTDQPLPYAIVAARAEVVESGNTPAAVAAVDAALRRWGNVYGEVAEPPGQAERSAIALFVGAAAWHRERAGVQAARRLLDAAGEGHTLAGAGRSSGYLAYTLGLHETARALAHATVEEVRRIGCRMLVTLSPEQAHTLRTVYPLLGAPLPDDVEVVELTALLAKLLDERRLRLRPAPLDLLYHDPCQTPRLAGRWRAPRQLLSAVTTEPLREGFWREKRAMSCGASGGLPWTQPAQAVAMARAVLAEAAGDAPLVVTEAPGCLAHLRGASEAGIAVRGLYELLAEQVLSSEF